MNSIYPCVLSYMLLFVLSRKQFEDLTEILLTFNIFWQLILM